jgi:hypothetical protein
MPRDNLESYRDRRNLRSSPEPEGGRTVEELAAEE